MTAEGLPAARRIVVLVGSLSAGGAERVATTLVNAWARQGRAVWIVSTFLGSQESAYPLDPRVSVVLLADVIGAKDARRSALFGKGTALRRLVREIAPDVVVSFLTNVNVLALASLAGLRLPLVVSERVFPAPELPVPWGLRLGRLLSYPLAKALVVQTDGAARRYARQLGMSGRVEVIHNPLPSELAASQARAQQHGAGGRVIAMGRLTAQKGFAKLIEAFHLAFGHDPTWSLEIWGEGPLRSELTQLIAARGLQSQVRLCGVTSQPWLRLADAQMFVLSSAYEGFPNAMLEAMAVGLPCVAFDCPSGPRELSDDGSAAVIVQPGAVSGLVTALKDLAADPSRRAVLGGRAAAFVRQRFSEDAVLADWDRVFERLVAPRGQVS